MRFYGQGVHEIFAGDPRLERLAVIDDSWDRIIFTDSTGKYHDRVDNNENTVYHECYERTGKDTWKLTRSAESPEGKFCPYCGLPSCDGNCPAAEDHTDAVFHDHDVQEILNQWLELERDYGPDLIIISAGDQFA